MAEFSGQRKQGEMLKRVMKAFVGLAMQDREEGGNGTKTMA
jgi:hypothetical protein